MKDLYMTVGELKKIIADYPDDAKVFYQRIEDVYFEPGKGWEESSIKKPDHDCLGYFDQYTQVWGRVKYPEDKDLYLTAHY